MEWNLHNIKDLNVWIKSSSNRFGWEVLWMAAWCAKNIWKPPSLKKVFMSHGFSLITRCEGTAKTIAVHLHKHNHLAHNHMARQKNPPTRWPSLYQNVGTSVPDARACGSNRRGVIERTGLVHVRSLWVNKWQAKQRIYSFVLQLRSRIQMRGWNSHSGHFLTRS